jgi:uncharacterized protein (TIGR00288 family)
VNFLLLVDAQNIFYGARDLTKQQNTRINFAYLKEYAIKKREIKSLKCIVYLTAYKDDLSKFVAALQVQGYECKVSQVRKHGNVTSKSDIDVMMAVDAMDIGINYDIVCFASGDGDLVPIITALKSKGKRIEIISFKESLSSSLQEVADEVRMLDQAKCLYNKAKPNDVTPLCIAEPNESCP